jgi:hypothetical protein
MMRRLFRALTLLAAAAAFAGVAAADTPKSGAARAEEILKQARAALGGEDKVRGVQSLAVRGKFRRVVQEREMSGEREFEFSLPDKFARTESITAPGMPTSFTNTRTLNGAESWASGGGGRGGIIIMRSDGRDATPEEKARAEQAATRQLRAEMARYLLALLLTPPADFPVEFTYAGEATADDGAAEVIDAAGPEGFAARLFLDKQTHLPLMLSYRAPKPRVMMMTMQGGSQGGAKKTPEQLAKEAQEKMKAEAPPKPEEVEMQWRFSEYAREGGLMLPHRITAGSDGETTDEWEIKSYALNPQFKADKFQKK